MNILHRTLRLSVAVVVGLAGFIAAVPASADVDRYQMENLSYQLTVAGFYVHNYEFTLNPCDGTFSGTGVYPANGPPYDFYETVVGEHILGTSTIMATAVYYSDPDYLLPTGYWFDFVGDLQPNGNVIGTITDNAGNVNLPAVQTLMGVSVPNPYRNHGAFVSANPDKNDAAHSCIGMPIQSNKNK